MAAPSEPDPRLGSAAFLPKEYFATSEQGARADHAVVPERKVAGHSLHEDFDIGPGDLVPQLDRVDNTSDAEKRFDIGQIDHLGIILEHKVDDSTTVNGHPLTSDVTITRVEMGLGEVENWNLVRRHAYHEAQFDHRYQYDNTYLTALAKHGSSFIFADIHDGVAEEIRGQLDIDNLDNTSDALKFLRFTRRLDRRYLQPSSDPIVDLTDRVNQLTSQLHEVQSTLQLTVSSLSQVITTLTHDPNLGQRTKDLVREVLAELESGDS